MTKNSADGVAAVIGLGVVLGVAGGIYRIASGFAQTMEENGIYEVAAGCTAIWAAQHFNQPLFKVAGAGVIAAALIKGKTNSLAQEEERECYVPWRCAIPIVSWFFDNTPSLVCHTVRVTLAATKVLEYGMLVGSVGIWMKAGWDSYKKIIPLSV